MNNDKHLLFLTNFSEACYQALPVITEWADREQGRLTLLHVANDGDQTSQSRERLNSFFAEADRYDRCERLLLTGPPAETIAGYCRDQRPDVVFAPASKPSGLPRIFHRSLRARLIREEGIKLWTRGHPEAGGAGHLAPRHVAHVITGHAHWAAEACDAAYFAAGYRAQLHFIYQAPWPDIHDGTIVSDLRVTHPHVAIAEVEALVRRLPIQPEVLVGLGNNTRDVVDLLRRCRADVAFVAEKHAIRRRLFSEIMDPGLDRLQCDIFCLPNSPIHRGFERVAPRTGFLGSAVLPKRIAG